MPQTYLALPPTGLRIVGGSRLIEGLELGLTVEDRLSIGALASEQLIQEWARQAVALAPRRSGRLARSIRPRAHRGLEIPFYGPFQQAGNLPWLTESWTRALRSTPVAVRSAVLRRRPDFNFRDAAGNLYESVKEFSQTSTGEIVIDKIQEKAGYFAVALILVRLS